MEVVWQVILCLISQIFPLGSFMNLEEVMWGHVLHDFSLHGEHPYWLWFGGLSSFKVWLLMYRRNLDEYPLDLRALNRVVQASSKSDLLLQILWNLIICDLMIPLKVCLGWKEFLCKSWCKSVGLKWTLVSKWPMELKLGL